MQTALRIGHSGITQKKIRKTACLVTGVFATLAFVGCKQNIEPGSPQTAQVAKRDIIEQIPLNAELVVPPTAIASASEPFHSQVNRVFKSVGDYVKAGEPIVELQLPEAKAYQEQARLNVKQAETEYANAKNQWDPQIAEAKQTVNRAEIALQRTRQAASAADDGTGTMVEASAENPQTLTVEQAVEQRKQAVEYLRQMQAERDAELQPYVQRLSEARAALRQAKASANAGRVKAPKTGTITTLNAQPGQMVDGDRATPVVVIVNMDQLQVHSPMVPEQANRVKEGQEVNVTFDEAPDKVFKGKVRRITTRENGTDYVAVLSFTNTDYLIKPGYHPHIGIKTGRSVKDAPAVPAEAVDMDGDHWVVQVRRGDKWEKVPVTPGVSDGKYTSIESGVKEGDFVLVTPGR